MGKHQDSGLNNQPTLVLIYTVGQNADFSLIFFSYHLFFSSTVVLTCSSHSRQLKLSDL